MRTSTTRANGTRTAGRLASIIGANGRFSIVSGTVLLVGALAFEDRFDLPARVIALVGGALIPYGLILGSAAKVDPFDRRMAWLATVGDLAWVIGAAVLIAIPNTMSPAAKWTLGLVSLAVLDFALLQLRELWHASSRRRSVGP